MRKNRRISKRMSVMATNSMRFGSIIVVFVVMAILYALSGSSCTQLANAKGEKERLLAKLEESRTRESSRWERMLTPEGIERALRANALSMKPPKAGQIVRMRADGLPRPGQLSVAMARRRLEGYSVAVETPARAAKTVQDFSRRTVRR